MDCDRDDIGPWEKFNKHLFDDKDGDGLVVLKTEDPCCPFERKYIKGTDTRQWRSDATAIGPWERLVVTNK